LGREKQLPAVLVRAETYAREALAWLLEDRVAARVDVAAEISRPGWLGLAIAITRPGADVAVQYRYDVVWAGQAARAEAV
jgi:phage gp46-like protein